MIPKLGRDKAEKEKCKPVSLVNVDVKNKEIIAINPENNSL